MVLGIQILGTFFGLFMVYYTFLHFKRKEFTLKEFTFWLFSWIIFIYVSLFPTTLDFIVEKLSLTRAMDLFIIAGFMVMIAIFFYTYTLVRINQKKIEFIVRKVAKQKK